MELYITILLIITVIIVYLLYCILKNKNINMKGEIPCVEGSLPFIGHNWSLIRMQESFIWMFYKFYKSQPNCSMIRYFNFRTPGLLVRDPELIKTVMLTGFSHFNKNTSSLDPHLDPLLTSNPFFTADGEWKTNRTILLNGLSSGKLKHIARRIGDVATKFSEYLKAETNGARDAVTVNAVEMLSCFTAEVVAIAGFGFDGKSFSKEPQTFETMVRPMLQPGSFDEFINIIVFFFPILGKIFRIRFMPKEIDQYFRYVIKSVLKSRKDSADWHNDFVEQVSELSRISESGEIDENLVTCHSSAFFLDGYITSAITLAFTTYQIAAHPEIQEKLRQEVTHIFENNHGDITYDALQDMKYTEQVINESMRLFPALGYLGKVCTEEIKLVGADGLECIIKPGTEVIIPVLGLHRDPELWENPDEFDPERFSEGKKNDRHKFIYLPFGSGPRICVGMRVAVMQMKAAIATLVRNYSLTVDSRTEEPIRVHPLSGLFTAPHSEMWIRIKPLI